MPGTTTVNNITVGSNAQDTSQCSVNGANDTERAFQWRTGGLLRAELLIEGDEAGSDAGGDLRLACYSDDGTTPTGDALTIDRATAAGRFGVNLHWRQPLSTDAGVAVDSAGQDPDVAGWVVLQTGRMQAYLVDFDKDTAEVMVWPFTMPPDYDGRAINVRIWWTATAGTAGVVRWLAQIAGFSDDDDLTGTDLTTLTIDDTFLAQNDLHICSKSFTPSDVAANDLCLFRLNRAATSGSDTFDADARLIHVELSFI